MNEIQISTFTWLWILGMSVCVGIFFGYILGLLETHIVNKAIDQAKKEDIQHG